MNSILINKPSDIKTKWFYNELSIMINNNIKDIRLECAFVCDDFGYLLNQFRLLKNEIAFNRDIRRKKYELA